MGLSFIPYLLAPYEQIYSACFFLFYLLAQLRANLLVYIIYHISANMSRRNFSGSNMQFSAAFGGKQQHSEAKRSFASSPGCKPGGDGGRAAPHFSFLFSVFLFIFNKNISSEIPDTSYEQEHHVPARCILSHILTKAV